MLLFANPRSPLHLRQKHHTDPSEAARLDEALAAREQRVSVNSLRTDLLPPGDVLRSHRDAKEQRSIRDEGLHERPHQHASSLLTGPGGTVKHPMVAAELPLLL